MTVGVVTGLAAEARIATGLGDVIAGGGKPDGAERAAEMLVARGARALLSFGLAGGLDPGLKPGAIVVPLAVIEGAASYNTDAALSTALGGWFGGFMVASDRIVVTRDDKRALFEATLACAVDLESGAVARVAARHGLPFAVLRAICDPAVTALPPAALAALDTTGTIAFGRVAASVLSRPSQIPALARLGRDAAAARKALVGRVRRIVDQGGLVVL
jgi:adenosylhomocysteine nucleosidase